MNDKNKITTYKGKHMNPFSCTQEDICIEDIAHSLSLICRGNGHYNAFFSVAQHCLLCREEAKLRGYSALVQLHCLMHDSQEAYIGDVTRPLKRQMPDYNQLEARMQSQVFAALNVPPLPDSEKPRVSEVDDAVLYHEFALFNGDLLYEEEPKLYACIDRVLHPFEEIEARFIAEFRELSDLVK